MRASLRGVSDDVYKQVLQKKLSLSFESIAQISKRRKPETLEEKAAKVEAEKIDENENQKKSHCPTFSEIPSYGIPLEKGQLKIEDFFKPQSRISDAPVVEIKEEKPELAEENEEEAEIQSCESKNEIILNPTLQGKVKRLLSKKLTTKAMNSKIIVEINGFNLKWPTFQELKQGYGISCVLIDAYSKLLSWEAEKLGLNICILDANFIQVALAGSSCRHVSI